MNALARQGVLFNFPLQKYQGQRYCEDVIDGEEPLAARYDLMRNGGYSFDIANAMASAAGVSYCVCSDMKAAVGIQLNFCKQFEINYRNGYDD